MNISENNIKNINKIISFILCLVIVVNNFGYMLTFAVDNSNTKGSVTTLDISDGNIKLPDEQEENLSDFIITGNNNGEYKIDIDGNTDGSNKEYNITIDGLTVSSDSPLFLPLAIRNATVNLILKGENYIKSGKSASSIVMDENGKLNIMGEGSLRVVGGTDDSCFGISGGEVTISETAKVKVDSGDLTANTKDGDGGHGISTSVIRLQDTSDLVVRTNYGTGIQGDISVSTASDVTVLSKNGNAISGKYNESNSSLLYVNLKEIIPSTSGIYISDVDGRDGNNRTIETDGNLKSFLVSMPDGTYSIDISSGDEYYILKDAASNVATFENSSNSNGMNVPSLTLSTEKIVSSISSSSEVVKIGESLDLSLNKSGVISESGWSISDINWSIKNGEGFSIVVDSSDAQKAQLQAENNTAMNVTVQVTCKANKSGAEGLSHEIILTEDFSVLLTEIDLSKENAIITSNHNDMIIDIKQSDVANTTSNYVRVGDNTNVTLKLDRVNVKADEAFIIGSDSNVKIVLKNESGDDNASTFESVKSGCAGLQIGENSTLEVDTGDGTINFIGEKDNPGVSGRKINGISIYGRGVFDARSFTNGSGVKLWDANAGSYLSISGNVTVNANANANFGIGGGKGLEAERYSLTVSDNAHLLGAGRDLGIKVSDLVVEDSAVVESHQELSVNSLTISNDAEVKFCRNEAGWTRYHVISANDIIVKDNAKLTVEGNSSELRSDSGSIEISDNAQVSAQNLMKAKKNIKISGENTQVAAASIEATDGNIEIGNIKKLSISNYIQAKGSINIEYNKSALNLKDYISGKNITFPSDFNLTAQYIVDEGDLKIGENSVLNIIYPSDGRAINCTGSITIGKNTTITAKTGGGYAIYAGKEIRVGENCKFYAYAKKDQAITGTFKGANMNLLIVDLQDDDPLKPNNEILYITDENGTLIEKIEDGYGHIAISVGDSNKNYGVDIYSEGSYKVVKRDDQLSPFKFKVSTLYDGSSIPTMKGTRQQLVKILSEKADLSSGESMNVNMKLDNIEGTGWSISDGYSWSVDGSAVTINGDNTNDELEIKAGDKAGIVAVKNISKVSKSGVTDGEVDNISLLGLKVRSSYFDLSKEPAIIDSFYDGKEVYVYQSEERQTSNNIDVASDINVTVNLGRGLDGETAYGVNIKTDGNKSAFNIGERSTVTIRTLEGTENKFNASVHENNSDSGAYAGIQTNTGAKVIIYTDNYSGISGFSGEQKTGKIFASGGGHGAGIGGGRGQAGDVSIFGNGELEAIGRRSGAAIGGGAWGAGYINIGDGVTVKAINQLDSSAIGGGLAMSAHVTISGSAHVIARGTGMGAIGGDTCAESMTVEGNAIVEAYSDGNYAISSKNIFIKDSAQVMAYNTGGGIGSDNSNVVIQGNASVKAYSSNSFAVGGNNATVSIRDTAKVLALSNSEKAIGTVSDQSWSGNLVNLRFDNANNMVSSMSLSKDNSSFKEYNVSEFNFKISIDTSISNVDSNLERMNIRSFVSTVDEDNGSYVLNIADKNGANITYTVAKNTQGTALLTSAKSIDNIQQVSNVSPIEILDDGILMQDQPERLEVLIVPNSGWTLASNNYKWTSDENITLAEASGSTNNNAQNATGTQVGQQNVTVSATMNNNVLSITDANLKFTKSYSIIKEKFDLSKGAVTMDYSAYSNRTITIIQSDKTQTGNTITIKNVENLTLKLDNINTTGELSFLNNGKLSIVALGTNNIGAITSDNGCALEISGEGVEKSSINASYIKNSRMEIKIDNDKNKTIKISNITLKISGQEGFKNLFGNDSKDYSYDNVLNDITIEKSNVNIENGSLISHVNSKGSAASSSSNKIIVKDSELTVGVSINSLINGSQESKNNDISISLVNSIVSCGDGIYTDGKNSNNTDNITVADSAVTAKYIKSSYGQISINGNIQERITYINNSISEGSGDINAVYAGKGIEVNSATLKVNLITESSSISSVNGIYSGGFINIYNNSFVEVYVNCSSLSTSNIKGINSVGNITIEGNSRLDSHATESSNGRNVYGIFTKGTITIPEGNVLVASTNTPTNNVSYKNANIISGTWASDNVTGMAHYTTSFALNSDENILISDVDDATLSIEFRLPKGNQNYFVTTGKGGSTNNLTAIDLKKNIIDFGLKLTNIKSNQSPNIKLLEVQLENDRSVYDISNPNDRTIKEHNSLITIMQSGEEVVNETVTINSGLGTSRIRILNINVHTANTSAMTISNQAGDNYTIAVLGSGESYLKSDNKIALNADGASLNFASSGKLIVDSGSEDEAIKAKKLEFASECNVSAISKGSTAISSDEMYGIVLCHSVIGDSLGTDDKLKIYNIDNSNLQYYIDFPAGYKSYALSLEKSGNYGVYATVNSYDVVKSNYNPNSSSDADKKFNAETLGGAYTFENVKFDTEPKTKFDLSLGNVEIKDGNKYKDKTVTIYQSKSEETENTITIGSNITGLNLILDGLNVNSYNSVIDVGDLSEVTISTTGSESMLSTKSSNNVLYSSENSKISFKIDDKSPDLAMFTQGDNAISESAKFGANSQPVLNHKLSEALDSASVIYISNGNTLEKQIKAKSGIKSYAIPINSDNANSKSVTVDIIEGTSSVQSVVEQQENMTGSFALSKPQDGSSVPKASMVYMVDPATSTIKLQTNTINLGQMSEATIINSLAANNNGWTYNENATWNVKDTDAITLINGESINDNSGNLTVAKDDFVYVFGKGAKTTDLSINISLTKESLAGENISYNVSNTSKITVNNTKTKVTGSVSIQPNSENIEWGNTLTAQANIDDIENKYGLSENLSFSWIRVNSGKETVVGSDSKNYTTTSSDANSKIYVKVTINSDQYKGELISEKISIAKKIQSQLPESFESEVLSSDSIKLSGLKDNHSYALTREGSSNLETITWIKLSGSETKTFTVNGKEFTAKADDDNNTIIFSGLNSGTEYSFISKISETNEYFESSIINSPVTASTLKKRTNSPREFEISKVTYNSVKVVEQSGENADLTQEYTIVQGNFNPNNVEWKTYRTGGITFDGLSSATEYTIITRIAQSDEYAAGDDYENSTFRTKKQAVFSWPSSAVYGELNGTVNVDGSSPSGEGVYEWSISKLTDAGQTVSATVSFIPQNKGDDTNSDGNDYDYENVNSYNSKISWDSNGKKVILNDGLTYYINKKNITIEGVSVVKEYDGDTESEIIVSSDMEVASGNNAVKLTGLVDGQNIRMSLQATFNSQYVTADKADITGFTLLDGDGENKGLASNYQIDSTQTLPTSALYAKINPRKISISKVSIEKVYDNVQSEELQFSAERADGRKVEFSTVVSGDTLGLKAKVVYDDITVGSGKLATLTDLKLTSEDSDILENYSLTDASFSTNNVTIQQRDVTITPKSNQSKIYDGNEVDAKSIEYDVSGGVEGIQFTGSLALEDSTKNVGEYEIVQGTLDNTNYDIKFTTGVKYEINPKEISISKVEINKVYDRISNETQNFTQNVDSKYKVYYDSLVEGESLALNAKITFDSVDVKLEGESANGVKLSNVKLIDLEGESGSKDNYKLNSNEYTGSDNDKIIISKREINIDTINISKEYNGSNAEEKTINMNGTDANNNVKFSNLVEGDVVSVNTKIEYNSCNVYEANSAKLSDIVLEGEKAKNYSIGSTYNTDSDDKVTITSKQVKIKKIQIEKVYDGEKEHTDWKFTDSQIADSSNNKVEYEGLVGDEKLDMQATIVLKSPDVQNNETNVATLTGIKLLDVQDSGIASNYYVSYDENYNYKTDSDDTINIKPKSISIEEISIRKIYNGNECDENVIFPQEGIITTVVKFAGLVGDQKLGLKCNIEYADINVGTENTGKLSSIELLNGENGGLATNYDINSEYTYNTQDGDSVVIVDKKKISIKKISIEKVYDGKTENEQMKFAQGTGTEVNSVDLEGTVDGEKLELIADVTFGHKDTIHNGENYASLTNIKLVDGSGMAYNYDVDATYDTKEDDTITIVKREISIDEVSVVKTYDGKSENLHQEFIQSTDESNVNKVSYKNIVEGEDINLTADIEFDYVNVKDNENNIAHLKKIEIYDGENGMASNYTILDTEYDTKENDIINIMPKQIEVEQVYLNKDYDGNIENINVNLEQNDEEKLTENQIRFNGLIGEEVLGVEVEIVKYNSVNVLEAFTAELYNINLKDNTGLESNYVLKDKELYKMDSDDIATINPLSIKIIPNKEQSKKYDGKSYNPSYQTDIEITEKMDLLYGALELENKAKDVGIHKIVLGSLNNEEGKNPNYNIIFEEDITYEIEKIDLVISVLDSERAYGELNPEFKVSYEGFIDGENESVLQGKLEFNSEADEASPVKDGGYVVTASGLTSNNYNIKYVPGTLIMVKAIRETVPEPPQLIYKTGTEIYLTPMDEIEYSIDGGKTWQSSSLFSNLNRYSEYSLKARIKENNNEIFINSSESTNIRTLAEGVEKRIDKVEKEILDEESGITFYFAMGSYPNGASVSAKKIDDSSQEYNMALEYFDDDIAESTERHKFYEISILDSKGNKIQPNGKVVLSVPVPNEFDKIEKELKVYWVNEGKDEEYDGNDNLEYIGENLYYMFTTSHFSYWALTDIIATSSSSNNADYSTWYVYNIVGVYGILIVGVMKMIMVTMKKEKKIGTKK